MTLRTKPLRLTVSFYRVKKNVAYGNKYHQKAVTSNSSIHSANIMTSNPWTISPNKKKVTRITLSSIVHKLNLK